MDGVIRQIAIVAFQLAIGIWGIRWMMRDRKRSRQEKALKQLPVGARCKGWEYWGHFTEGRDLYVAYLPETAPVPWDFMAKIFRGGKETKEVRVPTFEESKFYPQDPEEKEFVKRISNKVLRTL